MRLGIKIIDPSSTLNQLKRIESLSIAPGETATLFFQLVDLSQQGAPRYVPQAGATVQVTLPRSTQVVPGTLANSRTYVDPTISRAAANAFGADDRSVWMTPFTTTDTAAMISNAVQIVLTEGASVSIASLSRAITMIGNQDS
jgi:hypothetical protein